MPWCDSLRDLFRLSIFVQADTEPLPDGNVDAAFLFGQEEGNEAPVLASATRLYEQGKVKEFFCTKFAPAYKRGENTYTDFYAWAKALVSLGVPVESINPLVSPLPEKSGEDPAVSSTASEAEAIVQISKTYGWKKVYVISTPIHILRAFTNTVTFVRRLSLDIKVYAKAGRPSQPWFEHTRLNQGDVRGCRFMEGVDAEMERLDKWYAKGDLISAAEVVEYIKGRER